VSKDASDMLGSFRASLRARTDARHRLSALRDYGIVVSFLALFIILSLSSSVFLTEANLLNVLEQSAAVGIIACGGTLVIIAGGFDLSVGAVFAVAGIVAGKVANDGSVELGLLAGIAAGAVLGFGNGLLVTVARVNPFIATLASTMMIRGLGLALTGGFLVTVLDPSFTTIGRGEFADVKYSIWIFAGFVACTWFLLTRTTFGRHVFAAGGNPEAARLSGIRVGQVRTLTYVISGLSAGLAGVIVSSRISQGQADAGEELPLTAIAAIALGGTSIFGGEGAIWRTVLGVLLLALIGNGFNLLGVDPIYQRVFEGAIIVTAVAIDAWSRGGDRT
jgi:ribose transport system permease protein